MAPTDTHRPLAPRSADIADPSAAGPAILLVEDDDGDALLFSELLADAFAGAAVARAPELRGIDAAVADLPAAPDCIVLDLGLPDAQGLEALERILDRWGDVPVVVLTGDVDTERGVAAVAAGAQDYLVKGQADTQILRRSIAYAIARARADATERELRVAQAQARENERLERGLLPSPVLHDRRVAVDTRSRPGRAATYVGGDFFDVVETDDGRVHAIIGDVCGHGPDEAALGVCLRVAWRTLVLAGHDQEAALRGVERVLEHERGDSDIFVTAATLAIETDRERGCVCLAGHPNPLVLADGRAHAITLAPSPALGLLPGRTVPAQPISIAPGAALLLYTDGLIEGRIGEGHRRLGVDGLLELLDRHHAAGARGGRLLERVIDEVETLNDGPLADDVAAVMLDLDAG